MQEKKLNQRAKPFLRWAGSKKKIISQLSEYWDDSYDNYIEPFVGSAQLFANINHKTAVIGDINSQLITTYWQIKRNPEKVFQEICKFSLGKEAYYQIRSKNIKDSSDEFIAARLIYLNRFCFNGLYRTNLKGEFNVPYSGSRTGNLPELENLKAFSNLLKNTEIYNLDFEQTIEKGLLKKSFVYLDPPFALANKRIFNQYTPSSFGLNDMDRLLETLDKIDKRNSKFLLSYAHDTDVIKFFGKYSVKTLKINRNIAGFSKNRRQAKEILVTNIL